ncbi:MAG: hypothetical protein ACREQ5_16545 [Candidatus Dormibacteria bacterium]
MTSQEATTADLRADLGELSSLAVTVLNEHVNDAAGLCAVCGCAWPRELVLLADHNLEAL